MTWFRNGHHPHHDNHNHNNMTTTTTTTSNFGNSNSSSSSSSNIKSLLQVLYPQTTHFDRHMETQGAGTGGLSQLLLEHGEQRWQDWAVVASSEVMMVAAAAGTTTTVSSTTATTNTTAMTYSTSSNTTGTTGSTNNTIQWAQQPTSTRTTTTGTGTSNTTSRRSQQQHSHHHHPIDRNRMMDKDLFPSAHLSNMEGRLHLCTRSMVFVPDNHNSGGIIRCPLIHMTQGPPVEHPTEVGFVTMSIRVVCQRHVVIKYHNTIGPYTTVHIPCRFQFTFLHSSPTPFVQLVTKIYHIVVTPNNSSRSSSRSSANDNNTATGSTAAASRHAGNNNNHPTQQKSRPPISSSPHMTPELEALLQPMLDRSFDTRNLVDVVREQILTTQNSCSIATPLQSRPGILVVTNERIYFQPATWSPVPDSSSSSSSGGVGGGGTDPNNEDDFRAWRWNLRHVVAYARRYHGLRDSAIELYWTPDTTTTSSTLFTFQRRHDREQIVHLLLSNQYQQQQSQQHRPPHPLPCLTDRDFVIKVVQEWQANHLSNYEYLLALNCAAGRSFHDLSRYPVFPWVIGDYESPKLDLTKESTFRDFTKPVGALNDDRLKYFQTRLKGMQDMGEAFLYGTHYSAPGYVLYFLIRSMPEHMLCLQNGKFDSPDRIFDSVAQCYQSVLTNHADVKELIPEFYNDGNDFDFLINVKGLQLGATQNGDRVNDVKLPPWAKSARDFIKKNRKALESDICTRLLPRWLDLIFGCKSRGEGAIEANNIFHPNAYLGPTDLAGMPTEEERFQAELQATEFGIVPDQIFQKPHPHKTDAWDDECILLHLGRSAQTEESGREAWELLDAPNHMDNVMTSTNTNNNPEAQPPGSVYASSSIGQSWQDETTFSHAIPDQERMSVRNAPLRGAGENVRSTDSFDGKHPNLFGSPELSANMSTTRGMATGTTTDDPPMVQSVVDGPSAASEWDIRIIERKQIHNDTVSGCILFLDEDNVKDKHLSILVTTSLDGGLIANKVELDSLATTETTTESSGYISPFTRFSYSNIISRTGPTSQSTVQSKLSEYRTHTARDPLASLVLASDGIGGSVAFAGGHDDVVLAYGIKSACAVASVYSHRDAVTGLDLITRTPFDKDSSALWLENSTHILISGSWDATVKVWSVSVAGGETVAIHREPLAELFDADSSVVCVSAHSVPLGGIVIAAGCTDGCFCVWNVHGDGVQVLIHSESARKGSGQCSVVKCASVGGKVHLFAAYSDGRLASYTLVEGGLRRECALSLGVAIISLHHTDGILLAGCADGGLLLIPLDNVARFDTKPTLWKALNNKATSPGISSISLTYVRERCICCTGGADGSVVLFELKRLERHLNT